MADRTITSSLGVLRTALGDRSLRRALVAFMLFNAQEYAVWIAVAVYAFQRGGASEAGAVLVLQLVPAAIVAPLASVFADRIPRSRALVLGYGLQTGANGVLGLALVFGPAPLAYAVAVLAACAVTLTRPAHNAILPRLSETPGQLTAANAASSTMDGLGTLVGPLSAAVLMEVSGPGGAVLAMAVVSAVAMIVALGIRPSRGDDVDRHVQLTRFLSQAMGGLREARAEPDVATLLGVGGVQFVMVGHARCLRRVARHRRASRRRERSGRARGRVRAGHAARSRGRSGAGRRAPSRTGRSGSALGLGCGIGAVTQPQHTDVEPSAASTELGVEPLSPTEKAPGPPPGAFSLVRAGPWQDTDMHEVRLRIRWRDMDNYGHVNNAVYLNYLEECRDRLVEELFGADEAWDFVLAHVGIDFRNELTQADGEVLVRCEVAGFGRSSIRTRERIDKA